MSAERSLRSTYLRADAVFRVRSMAKDECKYDERGARRVTRPRDVGAGLLGVTLYFKPYTIVVRALLGILPARRIQGRLREILTRVCILNGRASVCLGP